MVNNDCTVNTVDDLLIRAPPVKNTKCQTGTASENNRKKRLSRSVILIYQQIQPLSLKLYLNFEKFLNLTRVSNTKKKGCLNE